MTLYEIEKRQMTQNSLTNAQVQGVVAEIRRAGFK